MEVERGEDPRQSRADGAAQYRVAKFKLVPPQRRSRTARAVDIFDCDVIL